MPGKTISMRSMPGFPDRQQISSALARTRAALGLDADAALNADEAGVFVKYLLLAGLDDGEAADWRSNRNDAGLMRRLAALLDAVRPAMLAEHAPEIDWLRFERSLAVSPYYRQRLLDLALEAVLSEPLAPELCVGCDAFTPDRLAAALPGVWHHAVIFAAPIGFIHELYPLAVDAYVSVAERINVVGAHEDWLTENACLKRILYLDCRLGRFVETALETPLCPDSVQFLCLGKDEQARHARLSRRFSTCLQVNPAAAARLADDKAGTLAGWSALGLSVPAWQLIEPGDWAAALGFFERFGEIVVKPNQATEGDRVAYFKRGDADVEKALARHLRDCWMQGDALVQQRRDGVCFLHPVSGGKQTLALRLNVVCDGERHLLESAYAQLGRDAESPASCGCGGRMIAIDQALSNLSCRRAETGRSPRFDAEVWHRIRAEAERAAGLFAGLRLVGLDVLLDHDARGNIVPVFLEANPRPAGLSHSRLCAADPLSPAPIGVSLKLWDGLEN